MVASRSVQLRPNVLLLEFDVSSVLKIARAIENNRIYHVKSVCQREGGGAGGENVFFFSLSVHFRNNAVLAAQSVSLGPAGGECVRLVRRLAGEIINHDFLLDLSLQCLSRTRPPSPSAIRGGQTHCNGCGKKEKKKKKNREKTER